MRINGDIQVYNRLLSLHNIPNRRAEWSYLSVGYYGSTYDEINILHQTQKNSTGVKYKVFGNILAVFTKYISQGKATIRFKKPAHDLIIQTDKDQMVEFNRILQMLLERRHTINILKLSNLSNVPKKVGPKPKIKLELKEKNVSGTSYPRTLQTLKISNANLVKLEGYIFRLQNLKVLILENNCLETLPNQLSLLPCLSELHLAGNLLGHKRLSKWLLMDTLQSGLVYLDLKRNGIHTLPNDIYKLQKLKSLFLDDNLLFKLPNAFGRLGGLKELGLSNNVLTVLPASFRFLSLDYLDISSNPGWLEGLPWEVQHEVSSSSSSLRLLHLSAKAVLNYSLVYDSSTIPLVLVTYLDSASDCVCGQATFPSEPEFYIKFDVKKICVGITFTECNLPIEVRFCSDRCRTSRQ